MSDSQRLPDPKRLLSSLPKDSAIIFRHYDAPNREQLARELVMLAHQRNIRVLIAGDWKLAHRCRADGIHYPEFALKRLCGKPRKLKKGWLTSAAVHNPRAAAKSKKLSIDISIISPVFATASHPNEKPLGIRKFSNLVQRRSGPETIALGGITEVNALQLKASGLWGLAGIGIFKE